MKPIHITHTHLFNTKKVCYIHGNHHGINENPTCSVNSQKQIMTCNLLSINRPQTELRDGYPPMNQKLKDKNKELFTAYLTIYKSKVYTYIRLGRRTSLI
jgi:hypothetical protein